MRKWTRHMKTITMLTPYVLVAVFIALLTLFLKAVLFQFDLVNIVLMYLFPVLLSAVRWGRGPSFFAAGIGVLAFDFFFVPPLHSFTIADLRYLISFAVFLCVAMLTANLAGRLRSRLKQAREQGARTAALYALSKDSC